MVCLCVPLGSRSLSSLSRRWLYKNALSGTVPTEVGLLTSMSSLCVSTISACYPHPSPPLSGSRLCVMVCVGCLSHVCVRARYPPPRGSGLGLRCRRVWGVGLVCVRVPLGSRSLSSLSRSLLNYNALSGTVPTVVCNLDLQPLRDGCQLGGNQLTFPSPFCASKCNNTC